MAMASSTSTIALHEHPSEPSQRAAEWTTSTAEPGSDSDNVVQASLAADAGVPDGGYGWVVIGCCSLLTFFFVGTTYSWGVIQTALVVRGLSSASTLAFVGSLTTAMLALLAVVNVRLIRLLGARWVAVMGVAFTSAGEVLSGFSADNVAGLFVTTGIIMGVGVSFCFMVVSTVPAQYFNKKRGVANGLVYAGGGLGGAVISFCLNGLLEKLGPAWTFRVIGFVTLVTAMPAAWLIQERAPIRRVMLIEWRLFRDPKFVIIFLAGAVATFPIIVPPYFLPLYAHSLGLSSQIGTTLVATFNLSSAVGRIGCGLMGDRVGPLNALFTSLLLSALSMLALWPVSASLAPLVAFAVVNGAANGGFFAIMPTVAASLFGSARLGVAMGMIVSAWAAGYLLGAPIAGYILQAYGGQGMGFTAFRPAIYYAGSMALGAAGLVGLARLVVDRSLVRRI